MKRFLVLAVVLPLFAGGCVRTVASVATAPFKVAGQAADWATTSQDEADRNYGRKMRKKEAREGRVPVRGRDDVGQHVAAPFQRPPHEIPPNQPGHDGDGD